MRVSPSIALLLLVKPSFAYQVTPPSDGTRTDAYKNAIEKATKEKVQPLAVPKPDTVPHDDGPPNYWFHPKIHTFGNTGLFGGLHAAVAPIATKLIDVLAYSGCSVRERVSHDLYHLVDKKDARVLDLCCGVGISTRALQKSFRDAEVVIGVDTSPEMIAMAETYSDPKSLPSQAVAFFTEVLSRAKGIVRKEEKEETSAPVIYMIGNAEGVPSFEDDSFDLVTIMYGFHEIPYLGRERILREARRLLPDGATLAIIDIAPSYTPSPTMLAGEPYVLEYKAHIQDQLRAAEGFSFVEYKEAVTDHVGVWLLSRDKTKTSEFTITASTRLEEPGAL